MPRKKSSPPAKGRAPVQEPETPATSDAKDEEMLTTKEVAQRLKLTPQTVQRLIHRGELPASRVAGVWRILRSDLQAFLQRTRTR